MAILDTLITTAAGALFATVGVVVGGVVSRRAQDRQWLRDKGPAAYQDLLTQYARFAMVLKRAHADRNEWNYDWAEWSAALVSASLVAPSAVAAAIDNFGRNAINPFLAVAGDPSGHPLTEEEFRQANLGPAKAQLALVNAIRRSLGRDEELQVFIGGSFTRPEDWPEMALGALERLPVGGPGQPSDKTRSVVSIEPGVGSATAANTAAETGGRRLLGQTTLECRPSVRTATDYPGRCAYSYGSEGDGLLGRWKCSHLSRRSGPNAKASLPPEGAAAHRPSSKGTFYVDAPPREHHLSGGSRLRAAKS